MGTLAGMLLRSVLLLALSCACAASSASARKRPATPPIRYELRIPQPHTRYVHVRMRLPPVAARHVDVAMPAWIPGSYKIRDFARHVYDLTAADTDGRQLEIRRLDKQTWRIHRPRQGVVLEYRVYAAEPSVRTSHVDDRHGLLNPSSLLLYVRGDKQRPAVLRLQIPDDWSAHTALIRQREDEAVYRAPDYDTLVDSPIQIGDPTIHDFTLDDTRFEYVFTAPTPTNADPERLTADARRITKTVGRLMGGFPFDRYVFLVEANAHGGGGLEHYDSTAMMLRRDRFTSDQAYDKAAQLLAHELFHAWNVKRIHDAALDRIDYSRENYTRMLWFHEGFTSAMQKIILLRAGLLTPDEYLQALGRGWTGYMRNPGRNRVPISQLSFEAWIKQYRPAPNHRTMLVSYYEKGAWIGLALDLELRMRAQARGKTGSLVGLFRRLMQTHGRHDEGIRQADIIAAASTEAGEDMEWFFQRHVDDTASLPIPELLEKIGVRVRTHSPWTTANGDPIEDSVKRARRRSYVGIRARGDRVIMVDPESPADRARVMVGDRIVAVGGHTVDDDAEQRLDDLHSGQTVQLLLARDERPETVSLTVEDDPHHIYEFERVADEDLDPDVKTLRDQWLATEGQPR